MHLTLKHATRKRALELRDISCVRIHVLSTKFVYRKNQATLTEQVWSIRDGKKRTKREIFLAGPTQEIPSGQKRPIFPTRVVDQNAGFASSLVT